MFEKLDATNVFKTLYYLSENGTRFSKK